MKWPLQENQLEAIIQRREWAVFHREMGDCYGVEGYLLLASANWLLIHTTVDFHLDGYSLIRPRDVTGFARKKSSFARILEMEGIPSQVGISFPLDITDENSILRGIKKQDRIVILEFEYSPEPDYLYIGKPFRVNKTTVTFKDFDACGQWSKDTMRIPYQEISTIRFSCEYANV